MKVMPGGFRIDHDSFGQLELSDHVYYDVQTQGAMENFAISVASGRNFVQLAEGIAMVKKAEANLLTIEG